ncbi:AAA family ATPase [Azohydromonas sediminis]|uniref:AAA family ATPase n=1 Tax=Azohydromonas sediminis TaxID=2259674 RepID=UPI000E655DB7|nr:AAA family ATPase [Azohydromonas sediminis]
MDSFRIAILGNAGSGKSTLARHLAARHGVPVLDLDTVAWEPDAPAQPRPDAHAIDDVRAFCRRHAQWVVEGCYAHLVGAALAFGPRLVFLNPGTAACLAHCRARPWEPHKYASQAEQDANLPLLLDWVAAYDTREGPLSLAAHRRCFDGYAGPKRELTAPLDLGAPAPEFVAWAATGD